MKLPKINARTGFALAALAVTLVASVVSGREKPAADTVAPAARSEKLAALGASVSAGDLDLRALQRAKKDAGSAVDLFAADAAPAEAPQAGKGHAAAAPAEAPLPFKYLGKVIDEGKLSVFLTTGSTHYSVQQGQTVAKEYRVERITEAAITFTYLPTGSRKVLAIPSIN